MSCGDCDRAVEGTAQCENCDAADMNPTLEEAVDMLRVVRQQKAAQDAEAKAIYAQIEATELGQRYAAATQEWLRIQDREYELDRQVREMALGAFELTGDKQAAPGVGIRVTRKPRYDAVAMLEWCRQRAPLFVIETLDDRAITKVADKLIRDGAPVVIEETATVTIATDLDKALGKESHA